jgi:hypothetical protein
MKRKMDEEERERGMRTLEDPELVGEEAARLNREERLRREKYVLFFFCLIYLGGF